MCALNILLITVPLSACRACVANWEIMVAISLLDAGSQRTGQREGLIHELRGKFKLN